MSERLYKVLIGPHMSEKSNAEEGGRTIVFKIAKDASKLEVKKAVEKLFEVKVESVQTLNVRGKQKRFGRMSGRRSDWKKAYVTLRGGYELNLLDVE